MRREGRQVAERLEHVRLAVTVGSDEDGAARTQGETEASQERKSLSESARTNTYVPEPASASPAAFFTA